MQQFSAGTQCTAIFCYGLAICDNEWDVRNEEAIDNNSEWADAMDAIKNIAFSDEFKKIAKKHKVVVEKWKYEDCDQILLAPKDLILMEDDYEIYDSFEVSVSEKIDLLKAEKALIALIKEKTDLVVDFNVEPSYFVHLYYA